MPIYNLLEYSYNYSKTSRSLWQYYSDESVLDDNDVNIDFPANNNNSISFKFKQKITGQTRNNGAKDVEVTVPLKISKEFWRTLEMPLLNCEISLILTKSKKIFLVAGPAANQETTFLIQNFMFPL